MSNWTRLLFVFAAGIAFVACQAASPPASPASAAPAEVAPHDGPAPAAAPPAVPERAEPSPPSPAEPAAPAAAEPTADPPSGNAAAPSHEGLLKPALANETAPERYTVLLATTKGDLHVDVRRSWAPLAADRFYNLVKLGFFDDVAFFRVVEGFIAQTGLSGDPEVNAAWRSQMIHDDPVTQSNLHGMLSFAASGPNTRTTQLFINLSPNDRLDAMGFAPFARARELDVAQKLFAGYGEGAPGGAGPMQQRIQREGNRYLKAEFPKLDYIERATIADETRAPLKQRALPLR